MKKHRRMTCAEFTARMARLVASGENIFAHPHVKSCRMHRVLLQDLESIARAAQQLFPDVDPSDKVWAKIKEEIAPLGGFDERVSDPFPGCHLVFRTKVVKIWNPQDNSMTYDDHLSERKHPVPGLRFRAARHKSPPHPREGR
jgi:hypothetical protein